MTTASLKLSSLHDVLRLPAAIVLALLFLAAGTARVHATEAIDQIVAVVNDDVIMQSELDRHMERVREELQQRGTELPPQSVLEKQVLDRLILTKIQLEIAKRTGIKVDDGLRFRPVPAGHSRPDYGGPTEAARGGQPDTRHRS